MSTPDSKYYKIVVSPFKDVDTFVQRGNIYADKEKALEDAKEWLEFYAQAKVELAKEWEVKRLDEEGIWKVIE